MSKPKRATRPIPPLAAVQPAEPPPGGGAASHLPSAAAVRETVESVVIAFVLAFLFRTFEAEAFVIPTGSMAPTLMGRHKDVVCPICGSPYQASASEELKPDGAPAKDERDGSAVRVRAATCPMCRHTNDVEAAPSYNGDRILVSKFAYEFGEPKRWDVIVFKFPGDRETDAQTNFIKRLIGLPGETVRIRRGDIWIRPPGGEEFHIARKAPPEKLLAMLQPVFDNDTMPRIAEYGWPQRWAAEPSEGVGAWQAGDAASFYTDGKAAEPVWLRYRHLAPDYAQWQAVAEADAKPARAPALARQLITDFTAYDTNQTHEGDPAGMLDAMGVHWVGDLALACVVEAESASGELVFELRKGGRSFTCRIALADGRTTLSISGDDMARWRPSAAGVFRGSGPHEVLFSNCDNELRLWIDGSPVAFDAPTTYDDLNNHAPTDSDLSPLGIASVGAAARVGHLRVLRDIYYGAVSGPGSPVEIRDVRYMSGRALPGQGRALPGPDYVDFTLGADRFFVLGDNSLKSKDGRLWGRDNHWVPRELLIGKALFIYWPHSWDRIPYVNVPCPYFPNFGRMKLVR